MYDEINSINSLFINYRKELPMTLIANKVDLTRNRQVNRNGIVNPINV